VKLPMRTAVPRLLTSYLLPSNSLGVSTGPGAESDVYDCLLSGVLSSRDAEVSGSCVTVFDFTTHSQRTLVLAAIVPLSTTLLSW